MFITFVVFFLAIALTFIIVMIIRQRFKSRSGQNEGRVDWSQTLNNLTLQQLKQEQIDLEKQRISTSSGFINMNSIEKNKAIDRVTKINKKIEIVKRAIEER